MVSLLDRVHSPADVKTLSVEQLRSLAAEIRAYLVETVSQTGGHLAPSLGVVELTLALHRVYDIPKDKLIWDVGHQAYVHKILTGRREQMPSIRQHGGLSGFLRRDESPYDLYGAGHASTSISAALGFAKARDFRGGKGSVLALIGDGALTGGLALEGLNNAAADGTDITVILNDNEMSIAENVGALATYLSKLRMQPLYQFAETTAKGMIKGLPVGSDHVYKAAKAAKHTATHFATPAHTGLLFEEMGYTYIGPVDGHNVESLLDTFRHVRHLKGPVLVHVLTVKGKGIPYAEADSRTYHGLSKFSPDDGKMEAKTPGVSYTQAFAETLNDLAETDDKIIGITAAMPDGTGLNKFQKLHPERFFDVGIAEQHAVTFAAGLAAEGLKPVCAIYSTFLQRAYDPIIHDVALQHLPVRFFLDRAGLVGDDGGTHHGVLDLAYLRCVPQMVVMAPKSTDELRAMTRFALAYNAGPVAVRYPRGGDGPLAPQSGAEEIVLGRAETLRDGGDVALIALGAGVELALAAADELAGEDGVRATVLNARFCKPLDEEAILDAARRCGRVVTVEDGVVQGGFGSAVLELLADHGVLVPTARVGLPDHFVEHGPVPVLRAEVGLTSEAVAARARALLPPTRPAPSANGNGKRGNGAAKLPVAAGGLTPMPRKTRRTPSAPRASGGAGSGRLPGYALTALVAAALGAGATYAALRPALQAARVAPAPPKSGAGVADGAALAAQGNAAFDKKDWPTAITDYTQAIASGLDNPDLRTDLGTAYRNAHQPQQALEQYQAAQREDTRHENSLVNEGIVYAFDLNNPSQALTLWQQYLTRFPHGEHAAGVKKLIATVLSHSPPPKA